MGHTLHLTLITSSFKILLSCSLFCLFFSSLSSVSPTPSQWVFCDFCAFHFCLLWLRSALFSVSLPVSLSFIAQGAGFCAQEAVKLTLESHSDSDNYPGCRTCYKNSLDATHRALTFHVDFVLSLIKSPQGGLFSETHIPFFGGGMWLPPNGHLQLASLFKSQDHLKAWWGNFSLEYVFI